MSIQIKTEDFLGIDFKSKLRSDGDSNPSLALSLSHTQGVFFLLILGLVSSGIIFLREMVSKEIRK